MPNEIYLPTNVFKNILDYCGEPLPKNGYGGSGFGWEATKVYYRQKNGKIAYRIERLIVKCKNCGRKYSQTGYDFCSNCYKNNLVKDYYKKLIHPYYISHKEKDEEERMCIDCGLISLKNQPKWKTKCIKCYYKKENKCLILSDSDDDE